MQKLSQALVTSTFVSIANSVSAIKPVPSPVAPTDLDTLVNRLLVELDTRYIAVEAAYNSLMPADKMSVDTKSRIRNEYDTLKSFLAFTGYNAAKTLYEGIVSGSLFEFAYGPVSVTGEVSALKFSVKAVPIDPNTRKPSTTATPIVQPDVRVPVGGNRRPTFSTGVFFTLLPNSTFSKNSDNVVIESKDEFGTVLGALVHTPISLFGEANISLGAALRDNRPQ